MTRAATTARRSEKTFMFPPDIILAAVLNGLMTGSVYALIALGLTLVYGVLHIINFAHGATLTAAMFAVYVAQTMLGIDPYVALLPITLLFFGLGYALQRFVIGPASHGEDRNILLVTLGLSIVIENAMLSIFRSDTRSIDVPYAFESVDLGFTFLALPRVAAFGVALLVALLLGLLLTATDTGKAIRAVAKEKTGAALAGIDVAHIYAVTFGLGAACVAIAACLLMPTFYVTPRAGNAFILVAFTIVVLGGMGSIPGALLGALFIGVVESLCGLFFGESLGQIGIFLIFILVLLVKPTGLFGARA
jgi:branched-chain amino acid transport system permease protein